MTLQPDPPDQVLRGLWGFSAIHPEWEDDNDGWEPEVAWWALDTGDGVLLIDPLVEDWEGLDALVTGGGGCCGIIRTTYWHERTIPQARARYGTEVWARPGSSPDQRHPFDRPAPDGTELPGGVRAIDVVRDDEIALWLPDQKALVFGDVMLRDPSGKLSICPESWIARSGGRGRVRQALEPLLELDPEHVLVSHGPLVKGDGPSALAEALATA